MEKLAELIGSLKDYFNDFIGAILPGSVLVTGLLWAFGDWLPANQFSKQWGEWNWLPALSLIFLSGHSLLSLNELFLRHRPKSSTNTGRKSAIQAAEEGRAYKTFVEIVRPKLQALGAQSALDFNTMRNVAMSLAAGGAELGRRFMFISLFCYGTAAAAWIMVPVALIRLAASPSERGVDLAVACFSALSGLLLHSRGRSFELRAFTVPFSVAIAGLLITPSPDTAGDDSD